VGRFTKSHYNTVCPALHQANQERTVGRFTKSRYVPACLLYVVFQLGWLNKAGCCTVRLAYFLLSLFIDDAKPSASTRVSMLPHYDDVSS
jgi:hypothetical protein